MHWGDAPPHTFVLTKNSLKGNGVTLSSLRLVLPGSLTGAKSPEVVAAAAVSLQLEWSFLSEMVEGCLVMNGLLVAPWHRGKVFQPSFLGDIARPGLSKQPW